MATPAVRSLRSLAAALAIAVLTGVLVVTGFGNATTVALCFLLIVLAIAAVWGLAEAVVASLVAAACFNYFFLHPVGTWAIADPENWIALFSFLVVSIVASQLSERARRKAREAIEYQSEKARLAEVASRAELISRGEEFK